MSSIHFSHLRLDAVLLRLCCVYVCALRLGWGCVGCDGVLVDK